MSRTLAMGLLLFGGIAGPSDTFSESPIVNSKLLCPYSPLRSHDHRSQAPRTPAAPEKSTTVGSMSGRNPSG